MNYRIVVSLLVVALVVFINAGVASAHGGQPRLEINVERLNPGGVVDVRGVEFEYDVLVSLSLIGSQSEIQLGEIPANAEGEFIHIVTLPSDIAEGTYYFRGTTSHHYVLSPPITVWGTAVVEGGGQGERDEDDALLAPMPTFAPSVSSTPVPQTTAVEAPVSKGISLALIASILLGIGIVLLFSIRILKKR